MSADGESTAAQIFELVTGDFLFDPHSGKRYNRDEGAARVEAVNMRRGH